MHRFHRTGFIAAALLALGALALPQLADARPPGGKGGKRGHHRDPGSLIEEHADRLGLDDAIVTELRRITADSRERRDRLHDELHDLRDELHDLLDEDRPERAEVMAKAEAIGRTETELHQLRLATMIDIRNLLTEEQRDELAEIREEMRERFGAPLSDLCEDDADALCEDADDRWDRIRCLRANREELSDACREALESRRGRRHGPPFR